MSFVGLVMNDPRACYHKSLEKFLPISARLQTEWVMVFMRIRMQGLHRHESVCARPNQNDVSHFKIYLHQLLLFFIKDSPTVNSIEIVPIN
ncbi:hypothetical protein GBA52_008148 [Prunus armeniaca]|nr:hypothetical protein GBA52_008143 [Prunus armeniaca]KAH0980971.1 hypothetical protein GBA52_008148 [Prunus armeniaca]